MANAKRDVVLTLALARQYAHHANFSGTARQAVADGYSAVDAAFSALLAQKGIDPPRNHKSKFDLVQKHFSTAFGPVVKRLRNGTSYSPGVEWASLEAFYREWLASRYDRFEMSPISAASRASQAYQVVTIAVRQVAKLRKVGVERLHAMVSRRAFGYDFSEVNSAVGEMHDRLFAEAEMAGEMRGSKLGTKLASATNYCDLDVVAGDVLTQDIIREDEEIAREAARVYAEFNRLAERIIEKRHDRVAARRKGRANALNESTNFMLSLKVRYHGATIHEMGESWGRTISSAIEASMASFTKSFSDD